MPDFTIHAITIDAVGNVIGVGSRLTNKGPLTVIFKYDRETKCFVDRFENHGFVANDVALDMFNMVLCGGHVTLKSGISNGAVLVIDTDLNPVSRNIFASEFDSSFNAIATDIFGNIFCAGYIESDIFNQYQSLIVKFDKRFKVLATKSFTNDEFAYIDNLEIDGSGLLRCASRSCSICQGKSEVTIVKFDSNLNKMYTGKSRDIIVSDCVKFAGVVCKRCLVKAKGNRRGEINGWV